MKKMFIALGIAFALICTAIILSVVSTRINEYKRDQMIEENLVNHLQDRWTVTADDIENINVEHHGINHETGETIMRAYFDLNGYTCYVDMNASELGFDC